MEASGAIVWTLITIGFLAILVVFFRRFTQRISLRSLIGKKAQISDPPYARVQISSGSEINYCDNGKGPTLVLIHGIGASLYTWRMVIPGLSKKFRVIALDLPGFGRSSKILEQAYDLDSQTERLEEFFDHLELRNTYIIGSSMGGTLALWLSIRRPDLCRKLIAISPAINPKLLPVDPRSFLWTRSFVQKSLSPTVMRMILKRVLNQHERISPQMVEEYLRPYREEPATLDIFFNATETIRDKRLPTGLSKVQCPCHILWGGRDQISKAKLIHLAAQHMPHATSEVHHFAGHHLMEDDPDWLVEKAIEYFLD